LDFLFPKLAILVIVHNAGLLLWVSIEEYGLSFLKRVLRAAEEIYQVDE
jgi:hypothetical protein